MVSAHQQFSMKLSRLAFTAAFYESLLGCGGPEEVLDRTVEHIRSHIDQAGAAIFILDPSGFDVHLAKSPDNGQVEKTHFQSWFSRELVHEISQTNRVCMLNEMLHMGLTASPSSLRTLSAAAVPLGRLGLGVGFILVYRAAERPLLAEELSRVAAIAPGVREAILSTRPVPTKAPLAAS